MGKEFLKLENKLTLKLEINPISPLLIKLGNGKEERGKDGNAVVFITSDSTQLPSGKKDISEFVKYNENNTKIEKDERKGEPFIPGSTIRGLFREKFNQIHGIDYTEKENEKIENLFGFINNDKMRKGRIFIDDAYLANEEYRKAFFEEDNNAINIKRKIIKIRDITPIDAFTGKATVPLKFECIQEKFRTTLVINNVTKEELKNIYFIIRDSLLGEIRIGNSKTRGFGQIELNIEEFIFENYCTNEKNEDYNYIENLKQFFEKKEEKSIKLGENYLMEHLVLNDKKVDVENPSKFILTLFGEV